MSGETLRNGAVDTPLAPVGLEASVIGTILLHPEFFFDVSHLQPEDFFLKRHRLLWRSILHLAQQGAQIGPRVVQSLYNQGAKGDRLMDEELNALLRQADKVGYRQAALLVKQAADRRRLARLMNEALDQLEKGEIAERVLGAVTREGSKLLQTERASSLSESKARALESLRRKRRVPTGLPPLDDLLAGGIPKGGMAVLGARPGMGKTAFARGVVRHLVEAGGKVYWVSLDQDPSQILLLEASRRLGVPYETVQRYAEQDPPLVRELENALEGVVAEWEGKVFFEEDAISVEDLAYRFLKHHIRERLDLVVVDYLQFIPGSSPRMTDIERVSLVSRTLKALALKYDVAVLALAQLSREVERRLDKVPQNADLRDSGQVEQDADLILLLHRPFYYNPKEEPDRALIYVTKNKMGPTGVAEVYWDTYMVEFYPYKKENEEENGKGS